MRVFRVMVVVVPEAGKPWQSPGSHHYFQLLSVVAEPERLREVVEAYVTDGQVFWDESEVEEVGPAEGEARVEPVSAKVFTNEW